MKNMRSGFTMIELIFVIVIIGILAAVAIPKLAATRDDAKQVKAVQNLATCISDIGAHFTATGSEVANGGTAADGSDSYSSCAAVANDKGTGNTPCFAVSGVQTSTPDGNITVTNGSNSEKWCVAAQNQATKQKLSSASGVVHSFGGNKVKF